MQFIPVMIRLVINVVLLFCIFQDSLTN